MTKWRVKPVYKKIGKPWFFIVAIIIAAICYVTIAGIPAQSNGDVKQWLINGVTNLRLGIDIKGGYSAVFTPAGNYKASKTDMEAATAIINT
jgi:preprotein translocase subunit SecD